MEALKRLTGQAPPAPPKAKAAVKAAAPAGPSVLSLVCSKKFLVYWYATPPTEASGTLATLQLALTVPGSLSALHRYAGSARQERIVQNKYARAPCLTNPGVVCWGALAFTSVLASRFRAAVSRRSLSRCLAASWSCATQARW